MDYIRLIPEINGDEYFENARFYEFSGADELYLDAAGRDGLINLEAVSLASDACEIPLNVFANPVTAEDLADIFSSGADRVIMKTSSKMTAGLKEAVKSSENDRVYICMEATDMEQCLLRAREAVEEEGYGGIVLSGDTSDMKVVQIADFLQVKVKVPVLIYVKETEISLLSKLLKMTMGYGVILQTDQKLDLLEIKRALEKENIPVNTLASSMGFEEFKLNSDGMIPVVTTDYYTGEVLMVAYMTKESYEKTIETGKMCYYSRSRNELWTKGDTSGHYQYVKSLEIDCDNDTILAKVAQVGAACHTGNYSCFYRNLAKNRF